MSERAPPPAAVLGPLFPELGLRLISTAAAEWLLLGEDGEPTWIRRFPETAPTELFLVARFSWITLRSAWCRIMLYSTTTTTMGRKPTIEVRRISSGGASRMNQHRRPCSVSPRQPKAGRNPITIPAQGEGEKWRRVVSVDAW